MNARKILIEAMYDLVLEKPFEQITVQNVLDRADISRGTFYKYFKDKYDLANSYIKDYIDNVIFKQYDGSNWAALYPQLIQFVYDHKTYFQALLGENHVNSLSNYLLTSSFGSYEKVYLYTHQKEALSTEERLKLDFFNAGLIFIFCKWVQGGCKQSVQEFANMSLKLVPEDYISIKNLIRQSNDDASSSKEE